MGNEETPAEKLRWRLKHGDTASVVRALHAFEALSAEDMAAVVEALAGRAVDVRENAARVLGRLGGASAVPALREAAARADDRDERLELERAIAEIEARGD